MDRRNLMALAEKVRSSATFCVRLHLLAAPKIAARLDRLLSPAIPIDTPYGSDAPGPQHHLGIGSLPGTQRHLGLDALDVAQLQSDVECGGKRSGGPRSEGKADGRREETAGGRGEEFGGGQEGARYGLVLPLLIDFFLKLC